MIIVSIDSAGRYASACVFDSIRMQVLAHHAEEMTRGSDALIVPIICDVMRQAGIVMHEIDRFAVTRGPGSFTGLRVGIAAAQGFALAINKPVIGINRFDIYLAHAQPDEETFVAIESRRAELFVRNNKGEYLLLTPEQIKEYIELSVGHLTLRGDAGDRIASIGHSIMPLAESECMTAARIAFNLGADAADTTVQPLYIRPPDVTVARQKR